jgi:glycolate oxidase
MVRGGHRPRAIELLDPVVVAHLRAENGFASLADAGQALLLVEIDGAAQETEARAMGAAAACEQAGARQVIVALDEAQQRRLWEMRRKVSEVLRRAHPHKVSEDVAVPLGAIPALLQRLDRLAAEQGVTIAAYGHAGDGNLHVNVLVDDAQRLPLVEPVLEGIFRHALDLGGTLTGEHGVGLAKRRFMPLEQSAPLLRLQRDLKKTFDPFDLMNPGKMLP